MECLFEGEINSFDHSLLPRYRPMKTPPCSVLPHPRYHNLNLVAPFSDLDRVQRRDISADGEDRKFTRIPYVSVPLVPARDNDNGGWLVPA